MRNIWVHIEKSDCRFCFGQIWAQFQTLVSFTNCASYAHRLFVREICMQKFSRTNLDSSINFLLSFILNPWENILTTEKKLHTFGGLIKMKFYTAFNICMCLYINIYKIIKYIDKIYLRWNNRSKIIVKYIQNIFTSQIFLLDNSEYI